MAPMLDLSTMLAHMADSIKPSPEIEHQGNLVLDELLGLIKTKSRFVIHRVAKTGSLGKKTAITVKLDYDCLFFISESGAGPVDGRRADQLKQAFLDEADDILTIGCPDIYGKQTQNTDSFYYKGFYFDFLCCPCFDLDPEAQIRHIVQMKDDAVKVGLSEGTVIFMSEQSSFVHRVARLLKFWSHSVLVSGFFNGRSYTMELFAVMVAEDEPNEDVLRGFRMALDKIRNFRRVRKMWTRFYTAGQAAAFSCATECFLLDPTDPTNNLLARDRWAFFDKMAVFADETLRRLSALEQGVPDIVVGLFQPQPSMWKQMPNVPKKGTLLVGGEGADDAVVQPRALIQRPVCPKGEMEVIAHMLHGMLSARRFAVMEAASGGKQVDSRDLEQIILQDSRSSLQNCVETSLTGQVTWVASSERFENKSVVLILPIGGHGQFIKLGFELERNAVVPPEADCSTASSYSVYWGRRREPRMAAYSAR